MVMSIFYNCWKQTGWFLSHFTIWSWSIVFIISPRYYKTKWWTLVHIKSSIPSRQLSYGSICNSIQAIPFEINLRQEKWLVISIYRPPPQDSGFFIHSLTEIIDHFATKYDNHLIMGDFNMEPNNCMFKSFLDSNNLTNLIKTYTCFKGKGSSIYLILTNRKYSFKYTSSYETGLVIIIIWSTQCWSPHLQILSQSY